MGSGTGTRTKSMEKKPGFSRLWSSFWAVWVFLSPSEKGDLKLLIYLSKDDQSSVWFIHCRYRTVNAILTHLCTHVPPFSCCRICLCEIKKVASSTQNEKCPETQSFLISVKPSSILLLHSPTPTGSPAAATRCLCCCGDGRHPTTRPVLASSTKGYPLFPFE